MKLSKADFIGTGNVFRFTLAAHLKNRSNIVSMIIMLVFAIVSAPVMALVSGGGFGGEQVELVNSAFSVQVVTESEYFSRESIAFETKFAVQYVYSILVMLISIMSASYIARAIVEEKASKLVELLMVSVRPLALILGKILAVMVFVFGLFVLMAGGHILSRVGQAIFGHR